MKDRLFIIMLYTLIGIGIIFSIALGICVIYGLSWLCMWFCNSFMNPSEPIGVGLGFVGLIFCIFMFIGYTSLLKGS